MSCADAPRYSADARCGREISSRYGGEEFVMILPNTSLDGSHTVAERVRTAIAGCKIPIRKGGMTTVTVSIGVTYIDHDNPLSTDDLFASADRALYRAKNGGRNRVVISEESSPPLLVPAFPH